MERVTVHVIVASSTPAIARVYVRVVLALVELTTGQRALDATIEVRP